MTSDLVDTVHRLDPVQPHHFRLDGMALHFQPLRVVSQALHTLDQHVLMPERVLQLQM